MKKRRIIRKSIAIVLLQVLLLSIVPRLYLHDALANHRDQQVECLDHEAGETCVHQSVVHCHTDQWFGSIACTVDITPWTLSRAEYHSGHSSAFAHRYLFRERNVPEGRGPPAVG